MDNINNLMSANLLSSENIDLAHSERYHKEAIDKFEQMLGEQPQCVGTLCDWIASYHELALIYKQQGAVDKAQDCLLIPHQLMLYMSENNNGDSEQQLVATRALEITLPPLMSFANEHPQCSQCMRKLQSKLALVKEHYKYDH